ncbi:DUF3558 domain-containing protein [Gordonia alkaliphila]|uniref:DUF3558 domain-containing protein n=1 Tax=Gordonia alkaliphila TaxID=1053547 RepID=UPI001FF50E5C|nr:DUF3558 domain-containing protein [Gordonia alkaliphila]MCK0438502.1 DUF3558 domain-containing protein [Gordonia alkaliphila]
MSRPGRLRRAVAVTTAFVVLGTTAACTTVVDGDAQRVGAEAAQKGQVDTSDFEGLLTECQILPAADIAEAVGGGSAERGFNGAICRWVVVGGGVTDVTLAWYEWGDFNLEKQTAQRLGFTTENIQVNSLAGFTQRDPTRPQVCGVTAKSPGRGTLTWWVEPHAAGPDACASAIALMELVLNRAN